jgi:5,10-methenyltetrahydromethanopterin hydrogenase
VLPLFLLFPQQPSASDEAQGFGHRDVKVVTWFNKVLTQVTILNKLKPHIHTGYMWLFCSIPTTHLPWAGFEPLVHSSLWLRFQQQVRWMQPGTLMEH